MTLCEIRNVKNRENRILPFNLVSLIFTLWFNWKAPHKKQASDTVCTIYTLKRQRYLPCFVLHALLRKAPETVHTKTRQITFVLFLCGRSRRALCNNACNIVE